MSHGTKRIAPAAVAVMLATACGASGAEGDGDGDGDQPADMQVVAGGSAESRLPGYVTDVDVRDGMMAVIGLRDGETSVLWQVNDGQLEETPLPGMESMTDVAVAPDGSVMVVDASGIWRVSGSDAQLEIADDDAQDTAVRTENGDIRAVAVDGEGRLLWTVVGSEDRTTQADAHAKSRHPIVVHRLDGDQVDTVAGSDRPASNSDEELFDRQQDPPAGTPARGFAMVSPGPDLDLAADSAGVYLLASSYVLTVSPDGSLSKLAGGVDRDAPGRPFTDEGVAQELGMEITERSGISASDGRVVIADFSFTGEFGDNADFAWTGDFTNVQQRLIDKVMDGAVHDAGAVLVEDGHATTAAVHAKAAAIDGDWLYLVGQVDDDRDQAILVRTRVPDWR
ncbi:MAG: hypothetical protein GEU93_07475 [Propionibacteriales bacterium]|nr:hypothetical protein [Propionibacteriales bacterium]